MCKSTPQYLFDACENIDAGVFSGDLLYQPDQLAHLKQYVGRWQRAIAEREANQTEEEE